MQVKNPRDSDGNINFFQFMAKTLNVSIQGFVHGEMKLRGTGEMGDKNILDGLFHKLLSKAGICTPTLSDTTDNLKKAAQYTGRARDLVSFAQLHPDLPSNLRKADEQIEKVHNYVSKASNIASDVSAACQISEAISVLNKWAKLPPDKANNAEAAAAFDKLFGGVARFASKLPPPVNEYARILEQISIVKFFAHMQVLGGPESRPSGGKLLKEIMDSRTY